MPTIAEVIRTLTVPQRERLADIRGVTVEGLAKSYRGDWVTLVGDLTLAELLRSLKVLPERELRVVVLRAFDGYNPGLDRIGWLQDGEWSVERQADGIVEALCGWGPEKLYRNTWEGPIARRLRDAGFESNRTPDGNADAVRLRRIFAE